MSHYLKFETQITDQEALVKALCRCQSRMNKKEFTKAQIESLEKPEHLEGFHGDTRPEVAHVILRRRYVGDSSNDIGFVRNKDGKYEAIISEFDKSFYNADWNSKLYTYYNVEKSKMELDSRGVKYTEQIDDKGRIQLRARFKVTEDATRVGVRVGR